LGKKQIVLDKQFNGHFDLLPKSLTHRNRSQMLHLLIVLLKFFSLRLALDVKTVQRKHTVGDEIGQVLSKQLRVVKHPVELVKVTPHHYEIQWTFELETE